MKKTFLRWLYALIGVLGLVAVYVASVWYAESRAWDRAAAFCEPIALGDAAAQIRERAISLGVDERNMRWSRDNQGVDILFVEFTGASPFSRYICSIKAKDGRVTARETIYLD